MAENRYICIHGHFYQPPRENPWLEVIESQESAAPYSNWNARIDAECYSPNSAARIQDSHGKILGIVNNYERISFNFGPTLLSWMEIYSPETYKEIIQADKKSVERFNGHGSAIAQVYNHIILPLANTEDKETQIIWGIEDFKKRFHRSPQGMWLAETAVDSESLELMVKHGIKFTILSPYQAHKIRPIKPALNDHEWESVIGNSFNVNRPYLCKLPNGSSITVFFYNGEISQAVAFEGVLNSGEQFAGRLLTGFDITDNQSQLLNIATDGETYGHHHKFGDMALAYALHYLEVNKLAKLTNYSEYLSLYPADWEVKIVENSSWSCAHGVERWRSNCGCHTGGEPGWNQKWRAPLRDALNWLRDELNRKTHSSCASIFDDAIIARNSYINVILDRSHTNIMNFLETHGVDASNSALVTQALRALELQRQLMLMFTSCGWFFSEISGVETVQILNYACRAIQLASEIYPNEVVEEDFIKKLHYAQSNIVEKNDAGYIYIKNIKPHMITLFDFGAHYCITTLFEPPNGIILQNAFTTCEKSHEYLTSGNAKLVFGDAQLMSNITLESKEITFTVLHLNDTNLIGGIRGKVPKETFIDFIEIAKSFFRKAELTHVVKTLDEFYYSEIFSIEKLFHDERQFIYNQILKTNLDQASASFKLIYNLNSNLMTYFSNFSIKTPEVLTSVGQYILSSELLKILSETIPDTERIHSILREAKIWNVRFDSFEFKTAINHAIDKHVSKLKEIESIHSLKALLALTEISTALTVQADFWKVQNILFKIFNSDLIKKKRLRRGIDQEADEWLSTYYELCHRLNMVVEV